MTTISDGTVSILVTRRNGERHTIRYDEADHEVLSRSTTWNVLHSAQGLYYARGRIDGQVIVMHRVLLPDAVEVDHVNHDGLDNRRINLRPVTTAQNRHNRRPNWRPAASPYKGVFSDGNGRWRARIWLDRRVNLGSYDTQEEAALAYDAAAREAWGEFAYQNFSAVSA